MINRVFLIIFLILSFVVNLSSQVLSQPDRVELYCNVATDINEVEFIINNGVQPYTLVVEDKTYGQIGSDEDPIKIHHLSCGAYTAIVTDAVGCTSECSFVIEPYNMACSMNGIQDCKGFSVEVCEFNSLDIDDLVGCFEINQESLCWQFSVGGSAFLSYESDEDIYNLIIQEEFGPVEIIFKESNEGSVNKEYTLIVYLNENDIDGDGICDIEDVYISDSDLCNGLSLSFIQYYEVSSCNNAGPSTVQPQIEIEGGYETYSISWDNGLTGFDPVITVTESALYHFVVTDDKGCDEYGQVEIKVFSEDNDNDGYCDGASCLDLSLIGDINFAPLESEIFTFKYSSSDDRSNSSCVLEEDYYQDYNSILYSFGALVSGEECFEGNHEEAIMQCMETMSQLIAENPICGSSSNGHLLNESVLIVTPDEKLCECGNLQEEIISILNEHSLGIWINFIDNKPPKVYHKGFQMWDANLNAYRPLKKEEIPSCALSVSDQLTSSPPPTNEVHASHTEGMTFTDNSSSLVDNGGVFNFGGIDANNLSLMQENVDIFKRRFSGKRISYITSADCVSNTIPITGDIKEERPSIIGAGRKFDEIDNSSIVIWVHQAIGGQVYIKAKVNGGNPEYNHGILENIYKIASTPRSSLLAKTDRPEFYYSDFHEVAEGIDVWRMGVRDNMPTNEINLWGFTKEIGGITLFGIENLRVYEGLWDPNGPEEKSLFEVPPALCGVADGATGLLSAPVQLTNLGYQICTNKKTRQGLIHACTNITETVGTLVEQLSGDLSGANGIYKKNHAIPKVTLDAVTIVVTPVSISKLLNDTKGNLSKFLPVDKGHEVFNKIKTITDDLPRLEFIEFLSEKLGEKTKKIFVNHPSYVDIWKKFKYDFPTSLSQLQEVLANKSIFQNDLFLDSFKKTFIDANNQVIDSVKKIVDDLAADASNALNDFFELLPVKGVKAWEGLSNRLPWVRTNTDLLKKIAGESDDYIAKVDELYSPTVMKLPPNLKPPNGNPPGSYNDIDYDKFGFPKLESHVSNQNHIVKIDLDVDVPNNDYLAAYDKLKDIVGESNIQFTNQYGSSFKIRQADGTFDGPAYTWHHHQDGESMMPVLQTVHQSIQSYHTGGRAVAKRGLVGLFDSPQ